MASGNRWWRTGSEDKLATTSRHEKYTKLVSDAANLAMDTWNVGGLSKLKSDIAQNLDLDVICLTETHESQDNHLFTVRSDIPGKYDKFSGVALNVNKRVTKYIIDSGSVGSRIAFCRFSGLSCNIIVVGVYIPRKGRTNPNQK